MRVYVFRTYHKLLGQKVQLLVGVITQDLDIFTEGLPSYKVKIWCLKTSVGYSNHITFVCNSVTHSDRFQCCFENTFFHLLDDSGDSAVCRKAWMSCSPTSCYGAQSDDHTGQKPLHSQPEMLLKLRLSRWVHGGLNSDVMALFISRTKLPNLFLSCN